MSTRRIQILGGLPQPDWNQTNETKSDYIKNKPEFGILASQDIVVKDLLADDVRATLDKVDSAENVYETKVDADVKLAEARSYTNDEINKIETRLDSIVTHEHSNMSVLETITAEKVASWDAAEGASKVYTDSAVAQKTQVQFIIWETDD